MEAESFFSRWSRRKAETRQEELAPETAPVPNADPAGAEAAEQPPPSMEDVARLTPESDFTPFVARGVDENVRRSAMKKLFADPHFNVMDGLDIYIEDYSKFEPIPPEMLAALNHAKSLLNPLGHLDKSVMALLETEKKQDVPPEQAAAETAPEESANAPAALAAASPIDATGAGNDSVSGCLDAQQSGPHTDPPCIPQSGAQAPHNTSPSAEPPHDPIQSL